MILQLILQLETPADAIADTPADSPAVMSVETEVDSINSPTTPSPEKTKEHSAKSSQREPVSAKVQRNLQSKGLCLNYVTLLKKRKSKSQITKKRKSIYGIVHK